MRSWERYGREGDRIPEVGVGSVIQEKVDNFGVPIDCSLMYQMLVGKIEKCNNSEVSGKGSMLHSGEGFLFTSISGVVPSWSFESG